MKKKTSTDKTSTQSTNGAHKADILDIFKSGDKKDPARRSTGKRTKTLRDVFVEELKDVYSAEQQLIEALPGMADAVFTEELQDAFENHLELTRRQAKRIEKIFSFMRIDREDTNKCEAMEGLINEGKEIISEFEEGPARDAALIIGAQKIEHYEIAAYGSLCTLAEVMGYQQVADILDRTLAEEEDADRTLTDIAYYVNEQANRYGSRGIMEEDDDEERTEREYSVN